MGRLDGKAIVITGAGRGLGEAYARAVAAEGGAVVVNDIDGDVADQVTASLRAHGARAVAHTGDVSSWDFAATLIERCVAEFGRIDGLVNNAGVLVIKPIEDQDEASFRRQIEVNLMGQAFCGLHALRRMIPQNSGAVVNIFSGAQAGSSFRCAYSAATAGVAGLTSAWAAECSKTGVRVNAVAPIAATREVEQTEPIMRRLHAEGRVSAQFAQIRETMIGMTADMNAPMVIFFLSAASAGINGQALRLAGNKMHLVSRPVARTPVLTHDEWTVDAIAEAFGTAWKDKLMPLGLAECEMQFTGSAG